MLKVNRFRRSLSVTVLSTVLVLSAIIVALAGSTTKNLSTNFTLVNLASGGNNGQIKYVKQDGGAWRADETFTLTELGAQLIKRQYDPAAGLSSGSGSVVVSAGGPIGAVVQIQARDGQDPSNSAYSGATGGSQTFNVPFVARRLNTADGLLNSQIVIQNASQSATTASVAFTTGDGASAFTKTGINLGSGQSFTYDLDDEPGLSEGFFGSAVVSAASGGEVVVVVNLFFGGHTIQTYGGFADPAEKWLIPLFMSKLPNNFNTPVTVQNLSGGDIPVGAIKMDCKKDAASGGPATLSFANKAVVKNSASAFFNPVNDQNGPFEANWFGSCTVDTAGFNTVTYVSVREVSTPNGAAHEALRADSTTTKVVIPLYMKNLSNGFVTNFTIQNLTDSPNAISIVYKASSDLPDEKEPSCSATVNVTIPAGGSHIENHRISDPNNPNGVPEIADDCFGTAVVTGAQAIDGFVQIRELNPAKVGTGDIFSAHNAFTAE